MSYKIKKPIADKQRADFVVEYNHNKGLLIQDGSDTYTDNDLTFKADYLFALDKDEIMADVEAEIDVADEAQEGEEITYHKETVTLYKPILNPDYPTVALANAKKEKQKEANSKAKLFLDNEALYELNPNFHVEATKENMNTLTSAAVAIEKGFIEYQEWTSKEDNVLNLTAEQCMQIAFGIGAIQGDVWCRQFINYKNAINEAQTVEEVESIVINYNEDVNNEN